MNVTLDELQGYEQSEFEAIDAMLYRGDLSPKRVIKSIIRVAAEELEWQGRENSNSLRDFWYNPTKPLLERAFPTKKDDPDFNFGRRMSQYLSDALSDMVKDGEVTYRQLNILDDSRRREVENYSLEDDKIVFVEKDAAYRKLKPLNQTYGVSIVSGSGWQATALIEDLARELNNGQEYDLYVLSDYDPTGFGIYKDFRSRADEMGINFSSVERIGISPEQLTQDELESQRFSPPSKSESDQEWLEEYGIDGQYGLEIEAIGALNEKGEALREVVVEQLKDDIRTEERYQQDTDHALRRGVQRGPEAIVSQVTEDLKDELRSEAMEIIEDVDGVEQTGSSRQDLKADLEMAQKDESEWLPSAPKGDKLHKKAISGRYRGANSRRTRRKVKEELEQRIADGEIDLAELVNVE